MAGDTDNPIALYPMVEEADATGTVAAVYGQVVGAMPMVPSIFKSLAVCPPYLALAWNQVGPVIRGDEYARAATSLAASVRTAATPPEDVAVREALGDFVGPLSQMLLLASGLAEALDARLEGEPADTAVPAAEGPVRPSREIPTAQQTGGEDLYGEIRAALRTPLVNSIWRSLAGQGLLGSAWDHLGPQVEQTRAPARELGVRARRVTHGVTWPVVAGPAALQRCGVADAAPGMATILDCYLLTLPRVLALVACCADES